MLEKSSKQVIRRWLKPQENQTSQIDLSSLQEIEIIKETGSFKNGLFDLDIELK